MDSKFMEMICRASMPVSNRCFFHDAAHSIKRSLLKNREVFHHTVMDNVFHNLILPFAR